MLKNGFNSGLTLWGQPPCTYLNTLDKTGSTAVALFKRSEFTGSVFTCSTLNKVAGEVLLCLHMAQGAVTTHLHYHVCLRML